MLAFLLLREADLLFSAGEWLISIVLKPMGPYTTGGPDGSGSVEAGSIQDLGTSEGADLLGVVFGERDIGGVRGVDVPVRGVDGGEGELSGIGKTVDSESELSWTGSGCVRQ